MSTLRVVVKEPFKAPEVRIIEHRSYKDLATLIAIGDFDTFERVPDGPDGLDLWANEEGKYASVTRKVGDKYIQEYAEANLSIFGGGDYIMGPAFIAATDDKGNTTSLDDNEVEQAISWLKKNSVSIIGAARARAIAEQYR